MAKLNPYTADQYRQQLIALLPTGAAWQFEPGTRLWEFVDALAQELARIDARVSDMVGESHPRNAYEMLNEWEAVAGLPDICTGTLDSIPERQRALVAKLTSTGGQSITYYLSVFEYLGDSGASIDEPEPMSWNDNCADYLWDESSIFCWIVNIPADTAIEQMTCADDCTSFLSNYGINALECVLNRIKPSHTHVSFHYE